MELSRDQKKLVPLSEVALKFGKGNSRNGQLVNGFILMDLFGHFYKKQFLKFSIFRLPGKIIRWKFTFQKMFTEK